MKRALVFTVLVTISFAASAQWYRLKKKPAPYRPPYIEQVTYHYIAEQSKARIPAVEIPDAPVIYAVSFPRSDYSYMAAEDIAMTAAQHNMRYGVFKDASYNFSELARVYILENKFSEAKWYLLQSIDISRRQKDNKHTVENLMDLALIKTDIGDYELAQEDLSEAYNIACVNKLNDYVTVIEQKMLSLTQDKVTPAKLVSRYSDNLPTSNTVNTAE